MEKKGKALIIGSGLASLSSAIRLRCAGYEVEVFESNDYPGGKLTELQLGAYRFDAGPSLFTMPHFVDELFVLAGKNPRDFYSYLQKEVVCEYFFDDGKRFTAFSELEKYTQEATAVFNTDSKELRKYFKNAQKKYELTAPLFLENSLHILSNYLNFKTIKAIAQLHHLSIFSTLNDFNEASFRDKNLQQLFNRYATYNGSSPFMTPGIMSMIPHLEQHFGTFVPKGGMIAITKALFRLAQELGVVFRLNHFVDKIVIENSRACAILSNKQRFNGDLVLSNMDVVPTYRKLLKAQIAPAKTLKQERSSSALIFYWGIEKSFPELNLHNILFSADYQKEFNEIFGEKTIPNDPTVYINISSKDESSDAPSGCENWFVMINVPGNTGQDWDTLIPLAKQRIIERINKALDTDILPLISCESILEPRTIESRTQSFQGSLYGAASNNRFAAFLRHPNFSPTLKNLYFCGGSVHPGGGIPLALLSGKITADLINKTGIQ